MLFGHWLTGGFATAVHRLPYLLTYTFNIAIALQWIGPGGLLPAWTLCIEEQFYLVWPNVLSRVGVRNALRIAICGTVLVALYRTLLYASGASWTRLYYSTDTRFDTLLVGCAAALLLRRGTFDRIIQARAFPLLATLSCAACLIICLSSRLLTATVGYTVMAVSVAMIIVAIYSRKEFLLTRVLSAKCLVFVGKISYGIYIFQTAMIFLAAKLLHTPTRPTTVAGGLALLTLTVILDVSFAWAHYVFIEARFLGLRKSDSRERLLLRTWWRSLRQALHLNSPDAAQTRRTTEVEPGGHP